MLSNPLFASGSVGALLLLIVVWAVKRLISELDKARTDLKDVQRALTKLETKIEHLEAHISQHWEMARKIPKLAADIQWLKGRHGHPPPHHNDEDDA